VKGRAGRLAASLRALRGRRLLNAALLAVAFAVALILPLNLSYYWQSVGADVLSFALLALGLNVVVGFAGLLDLGYVAFYAIGSYAFAIITAGAYSRAVLIPGATPQVPQWEPWMWLLIVVGLIAAMVTGVVLGAPTLRLRGDYLAIVTLGFGEIVRIAARNLDSLTLGPRGIEPIPHPELAVGGFRYEFGTDPIGYYYLLLALALVMALVIARLNSSRVGRAWAAIREDEVAAVAMGVPAVRMKLWAFAIGASTAGVAGAVQASRVTFINSDSFDILTSFLILAMVVLGGMGSIVGSILGALVVVALPEVLRNYLTGFQEYRFLLFGAVLVVAMIFRPQGLFPSRRRATELAGAVREGPAPGALTDVPAGAPGGGGDGPP
jgi:branched-chain amino acid transport system permease protein